MADIVIRKFDEVYIKVLCDRSIQHEIHDEFTFYVDGYKFMPKYKAGIWDGRISLFNANTSLIYYGLMFDIVKFAKSNGYTVEIDKPSMNMIRVAADLDDFIPTIPDFFKFEPRDYQMEAFKNALTLNKALILSPTGSGKSAIAFLIVKFLLQHVEGKILITVPTLSLVKQLSSDFDSYFVDGVEMFTSHQLYGGKEKKSESRVFISTWQTARTQPEEWFEQFDAYICDEAHQAEAKSISTIIENMKHAPFRIGLTGTLSGTKTNELVLKGMFGTVVKTATSSELMKDGTLAKLSIECIRLKYSHDLIKSMKKRRTYQEEIEWLVGNPNRNMKIINLALEQVGNTLVLFNFVDSHGEVIHKLAKDFEESHERQIMIIHGHIHVDERESMRHEVENAKIYTRITTDKTTVEVLSTDLFDGNVIAGDLTLTSNFSEDWISKNGTPKEVKHGIGAVILFASYGTFSTGVNIKNIHTVIFAHPTKSKIRNLQSIGRGLRVNNTKKTAKLIDIMDDLSYNGKTNVALDHAIERIKIYEREKFSYQIREEPI